MSARRWPSVAVAMGAVASGLVLLAPPASAETTTYEESSSAVSYPVGSWTGSYTPTGAPGTTMKYSGDAGAKAVLTFTVPEGQAAVVTFHTLTSNTGCTDHTWSLDGGAAATFSTRTAASPAMATVGFTTGEVAAGTHTLAVVKGTAPADCSGSSNVVDKFVVETSAAGTTTTTAPSTTTTQAPQASSSWARCSANMSTGEMSSSSSPVLFGVCQLNPAYIDADDVGGVSFHDDLGGAFGSWCSPMHPNPPTYTGCMEDTSIEGYQVITTYEGSIVRWFKTWKSGDPHFEAHSPRTIGSLTNCAVFLREPHPANDDSRIVSLGGGPGWCETVATTVGSTTTPELPAPYPGGDGTEPAGHPCFDLEMRGPDSTGRFLAGVDYRFQVRYPTGTVWPVRRIVLDVTPEAGQAGPSVDTSTTVVDEPQAGRLYDVVARWLVSQTDPVIVFTVTYEQDGEQLECSPLYTEGRWGPAEPNGGRRTLGECMKDNDISWNPSSWVPWLLRGVACVLEWAFVPGDGALAAVRSSVDGEFPFTLVGEGVELTTALASAIGDGVAGGASCGPVVDVRAAVAALPGAAGNDGSLLVHLPAPTVSGCPAVSGGERSSLEAAAVDVFGYRQVVRSLVLVLLVLGYVMWVLRLFGPESAAGPGDGER